LRLTSMRGGFALGLTLMAATAFAQMERSPAPEDADLYFITPQDGDVVAGTFTVKFGLKGMGVAPAGVDQVNTGHHHLIINVPEEEIPMQQPLPMTDQFMHFGGGQTETEVTLPPGEHTLQLVLGNYLHVPHDPPVMSKAITITVEE
jgi:hypothetical protein